MADDSDSAYDFGFDPVKRNGSNTSECYKMIDGDDEIMRLGDSPE
jgi:hypothetical protein